MTAAFALLLLFAAAPVQISPELMARRIAPDAWVITHAKPWPANALLHRTSEGGTILVTTPYTPAATRELLGWIRKTFGANPVAAINGHFHFDGAGGNPALHEAGVATYGTETTARMMRERGDALREQIARALEKDRPALAKLFASLELVPPRQLLAGSAEQRLRLGGEEVVVIAPGPAHSPDNLAVYFPRTGVLFAGCMVRVDGRLGNLADADVARWPAAMRALKQYDPKLVIPGHGLRFEPAMIGETEKAALAAAPSGAQLFGEGVFSTGDYELPPTFTADGNTAYFSISTPVYGRMRFIVETRRSGEKWSDPVVAPFSGRYDDVDPFITPDGKRLYFLSKRPVSGTTPKNDLDIWYVEREGNSWGTPRHLGNRVSGAADEHYVTSTADGTLYISAIRPDSANSGDLYRVPLLDGEYGDPVNLGPSVNHANHDTTPYVAPDESYVIFGSRGRPDSLGDIDLYITFRGSDGAWSAPKNLGPLVNSSATDFCPIASPDGRWLYFASNRANLSFDAPLAGGAARAFIRGPGNTLADVYRIPLAQVLAGR